MKSDEQISHKSNGTRLLSTSLISLRSPWYNLTLYYHCYYHYYYCHYITPVVEHLKPIINHRARNKIPESFRRSPNNGQHIVENECSVNLNDFLRNSFGVIPKNNFPNYTKIRWIIHPDPSITRVRFPIDRKTNNNLTRFPLRLKFGMGFFPILKPSKNNYFTLKI